MIRRRILLGTWYRRAKTVLASTECPRKRQPRGDTRLCWRGVWRTGHTVEGVSLHYRGNPRRVGYVRRLRAPNEPYMWVAVLDPYPGAIIATKRRRCDAKRALEAHVSVMKVPS